MDCRAPTSITFRFKLGFKQHDRYKLALEVDEKDHKDRDISNKIERQEAIKEQHNGVFIRINPDKQNFNIFKVINEIHR